MRLLLSTAVIVVLQKASQGCMNASNMSKPGGSRKLEPPVTRDRPNTLCLVTTETGRALQRDENWLPMIKSKGEARDTFEPKAYGVGGWEFGLGCGHRSTSEGWQQGRRARFDTEQGQGTLPASGWPGCQGAVGDSMQDPFRVQRRLLGAFSASREKVVSTPEGWREHACKHKIPRAVCCGCEMPGRGSLKYTAR